MKKAGVWLDQKEANIITISKDSHHVKTIYSLIETRERIPGESKQFGRFGDQYLNYEKNTKNKIDQLTKLFLIKVIKELILVDEFILFGPAQTKIKLEKLIQNQADLHAKLCAVKNESNITDNQKVAYVKKYFNSVD